MTSCQCEGIEQEFDPKFARSALQRYRRKGNRKTTQILLDALHDALEENMTLLDIGGGVGGIQLDLLESGLEHATSVEASAAFQEVAREEAARQGVDDRIDFVFGNFVEVADRVQEADIVTLDRVICCYDDMHSLVGGSASLARRVYGLVYPRDSWWTRLGGATANVLFRLRKNPMRTFVHPPAEVDALVRRQGFRIRAHHTTPVWRIDVYVR